MTTDPQNCALNSDQGAAPLLSREEAVEIMMGTYSYRGLARMALDNGDEIFRLRALLNRALPLAAHAVDVPTRELEAEQWLEEAREALNGGETDAG